MPMRRPHLALALLVLSIVAAEASANLVYYDSFSYDATGNPTLVAATTSNSNYVFATGTNGHKVNSPGLTYPNLENAGNDVLGNNIAGNGTITRHMLNDPAINPNALPSGGLTSGTIYYSLLFRVTATNNTAAGTAGDGFVTSSVNATAGSFIFGFETATASTAGATVAGSSALPIDIRTGDGTSTSTTFQLGTGINAVSTGVSSTNARIWQSGAQDGAHGENVGQTYFIVGKYTINAGAANNQAQLWLDPTLFSAETDNTPLIDFTNSGAFNIADIDTIGAFYFRHNNVAPDLVEFDEVRIGTDWESVMPEPASTGLAIACGGLLLGRRRCRRGPPALGAPPPT
jgi:hypothetical protein